MNGADLDEAPSSLCGRSNEDPRVRATARRKKPLRGGVERGGVVIETEDNRSKHIDVLVGREQARGWYGSSETRVGEPLNPVLICAKASTGDAEAPPWHT